MTLQAKTAEPGAIDAETASTPAPPAASLPYDDYAGEVQVANGKMPRWLARLPFVALVVCLAYYVYVRAFDPVNLMFAGLFVLWMIYTPIAQRRGWPLLPM